MTTNQRTMGTNAAMQTSKGEQNDPAPSIGTSPKESTKASHFQGLIMYTITYIQGRELFSISTPSFVTACRTFYNLRIRAGLAARMWKNTKTMIF